MRYISAMIFGILGGALTAWLVATTLSGWFSRQFTYTSPDGQADVEQMAFLAILILGIIVGWIIGWLIGTPFAKRRHS